MSDDNTHRAKVDFNDPLLTYRSPQGLIPRERNVRDMRNKDVSSLSRRRSKGLRVTNSLNSGAIISPGRSVKVPIPIPRLDKYEKEVTSQLLREIDDEVEEKLEIELESINILNQEYLDTIYPLAKCYLVVRHRNSVSIVTQHKTIECFKCNLKDDVREIHFARDKLLLGEFVIIFKDARVFNRKDLNLLNPNSVLEKGLIRFDKIWVKVARSTNFNKFHSIAGNVLPKIHHSTIVDLTKLFTNVPISPLQFYGSNGSLLKARKKRETDQQLIIETRPRTRSSTNDLPDKLNTLETAESIEEEDQHENIDEKNQIRFKPDLNYKFSDKRFFTITNADFKCLYNNSWINDNLIDFFLKFNVEKSIKNKHIKSNQVLLLNSFFFTKLISTTNYYENVKSWFKDDKLFTYEYVIIPVNQDLHWYCLIIHNLDKILMKQEDSLIEDCKIEIFILDSLNQDHRSIRLPLFKFLTGFALEKYQLDLPLEAFKIHVSPIPKQENFNDCGIHVIYNINIFLTKTEEFKEIWKKPRKKFRNNKGLFSLEDRQNLRIKLREQLISLLQQQEKANKLSGYEKVGTLTNKDFEGADSSKVEEDEELDSDFEILEVNENDDEGKESDHESKTKSKYFPSQESPKSEDSALLHMSESESKNLSESEPPESKEHDMSLLSSKLQENKISNSTMDQFYEFITDDGEVPEIQIGRIIKYVKTELSYTLTSKVIVFLQRYESDVTRDTKFSDILRWLVKYFNTLDEDEKPDFEVCKCFFEVFINVYEDDSESSNDFLDQLHESYSSSMSNNAQESQESGPILSHSNTGSISVIAETKIKQPSINEIDDDSESITSTIDDSDLKKSSDIEGYQNLAKSVRQNREKFMSSFNNSEDQVQILEEKIIQTKPTRNKDDIIEVSSTHPSILDMLPASNRILISNSKSRKKQKLNHQ